MANPVRIGILNDVMPGPDPHIGLEPWILEAVADLRADGRLDRDVELVHAVGLGLPGGDAATVERSFRALSDLDVLAIVGPAIGDNALVATPLADALRVPTINWAGSERARGEYMFQLQVGSHEDESLVLVRHLSRLGARRIAVVHDRSPIGRRHLTYALDEAEVQGVRVCAIVSVSPLTEDARVQVDELLSGDPDAVLYLGLGLSAPAVASALASRSFGGPKAMNSAGIRGHIPSFAEQIDGWVYVDMYADSNTTLQALLHRAGSPAPNPSAASRGHDIGRLVAESLARAPEWTRDGVRQGLEQVKWLPAAEGQEGTLLGFGHRDRGALHGRYLVLRQWIHGQSVEVRP